MEKLNILIVDTDATFELRKSITNTLTNMQRAFDMTFDRKTYESLSIVWKEYITIEADIVVFVCDMCAGDLVAQMLDIAYQSYMSSGSPEIFVYMKSDSKLIGVPTPVVDKVNSLHQYYTEFRDSQEFETLFKRSITHYLLNYKPKAYDASAQSEALEKLFHTLISCLNNVNALCSIIVDLYRKWEEFDRLNSDAPSSQNKGLSNVIADVLNSISEANSKVEALEKGLPPEVTMFTEEELKLLSFKITEVYELYQLPTYYASYFNDTNSQIIKFYSLVSMDKPGMTESKLVGLDLQYSRLPANSFYYSMMSYLCQFPESFDQRLFETQKSWRHFPVDFQTKLSTKEYEALGTKELDTYEKYLKGLESFSAQLDKQISSQTFVLDRILAAAELNQGVAAKPKFCPNCGCRLKDAIKFCPECGSNL